MVAVVAIGVAAFAIARDDDPTTGLTTRDIAATQQAQTACQQWFDDQLGANATAPGWCGQMTDWMYEQMGAGHMMGPMMWGSPQAMRDTCVQAMAQYQPGVDDPTVWCQSMVDWMSDHMGDGDGWMMTPSMMGR